MIRSYKMIIDFHTHCFPDALAPRALEALKHNAEQTQMQACTNGTASDTERNLRENGIDLGVVCNIATNVRQQTKVNDFAISLLHSNKKLSPLGSIHPDSTNKYEEMKRLHDNGIKGVKVHPDYVSIEITAPGYSEIFSICEQLGLFVITHAGWDPVSPDHIHASPEGILQVINNHPNLKLVAAHMGGYAYSKDVIDNLVGRDIYFDTSLSSYRSDERDTLLTILKEHRPDRLLFATDTPWSLTQRELEFIYSANLSEELTEKILFHNAKNLLNM